MVSAQKSGEGTPPTLPKEKAASAKPLNGKSEGNNSGLSAIIVEYAMHYSAPSIVPPASVQSSSTASSPTDVLIHTPLSAPSTSTQPVSPTAAPLRSSDFSGPHSIQAKPTNPSNESASKPAVDSRATSQEITPRKYSSSGVLAQHLRNQPASSQHFKTGAPHSNPNHCEVRFQARLQ